MSTIYLDASALLRVLFQQDGVRAPLRTGAIAISSRLVEVEAHRAVHRLRLGNELDDEETALRVKELQGIVSRLTLLPVSDEVIDLARAAFPVNVRSIDAIHVATAQVAIAEAGPLDFWTHDIRQATAALARGLDVLGLAERL